MNTKGKKKDKLSRQIKRTIKAGGGIVLKRGEWEKNRPAHLAEMESKDAAPNNQFGMRGKRDVIKNAIIIRKSEGATSAELQEEFGVGNEYIDMVLKHKFVDGKTGAQRLRDILLANAIQLAAQTRVKAADMNGMQSAVATGIMTTKYIEMDKHMQSKPPTIDMDKLGEISESLAELTDIVRDAGVDEGAMIDTSDD